MLSSRLLYGARLSCRLPLRAFSSQPPTRTQSDVADGVKQESYSSEVEGQKPLYATKATHQRIVLEKRHQSVDPEEGQRPTKWQRRFLVWTKLYGNQSEIPDIVAQGTMNRMHDRLRVIFIITGIFSFFTIFFAAEMINHNRIARDRAAGVVVTKM